MWMPGGTDVYGHATYLFFDGKRLTSTETDGDLSSGLEVSRSDRNQGP